MITRHDTIQLLWRQPEPYSPRPCVIRQRIYGLRLERFACVHMPGVDPKAQLPMQPSWPQFKAFSCKKMLFLEVTEIHTQCTLKIPSDHQLE